MAEEDDHSYGLREFLGEGASSRVGRAFDVRPRNVRHWLEGDGEMPPDVWAWWVRQHGRVIESGAWEAIQRCVAELRAKKLHPEVIGWLLEETDYRLRKDYTDFRMKREQGGAGSEDDD